MATRKFEPGQRIWKYNDNRRKYDAGGGGPIYEYGYEEFAVVRVERRSYLIGRVWKERGTEEFGRAETFAFAKAELLFKATAEKDDDVFVQTHRNRLADAVRKADVRTLRRVARLFEGNEDESAEVVT